MAGLYRAIAFVFWLLGLITTVAVVIARLARPLRLMLQERVDLRSLVWVAGLFFLGTIATWAIGRSARD